MKVGQLPHCGTRSAALVIVGQLPHCESRSAAHYESRSVASL